MTESSDSPAALARLDEIVDQLESVRAREATLWAAEMHVLGGIPDLVRAREAEYAVRAGSTSRIGASSLAEREICAEVAAALRLSERQVARRVDDAYRLVHDFPETLYDASDGRVSPQHAMAIVNVGAGVGDPGTRGEYERLALELAAEFTVAGLTSVLEDLVDRLDPEGTQDRIRQARAERGVRRRALGSGMAQLIVTAPAAEVEGAVNRLADMAAELHVDNRAEAAKRGCPPPEDADTSPIDGDGFPADERTRRQIMADIALDLLLTSAPDGHGATDERRDHLAAIKATVHITIPAATLAGTAVGGARIVGAGQIDDRTARTLAGDADHWFRVFTDPTTGTPITVDRRHPCKAQKRLLRVRDEHCRFPGCRRPARTSDIDHTVAVVDKGPTALWNLAHLCEHHHTMKHHTDWTVRQSPGGVLEFTAPTGRRHITRPPGAVRFVADRPPGRPRNLPDRGSAPDPAPF